MIHNITPIESQWKEKSENYISFLFFADPIERGAAHAAHRRRVHNPRRPSRAVDRRADGRVRAGREAGAGQVPAPLRQRPVHVHRRYVDFFYYFGRFCWIYMRKLGFSLQRRGHPRPATDTNPPEGRSALRVRGQPGSRLLLEYFLQF